MRGCRDLNEIVSRLSGGLEVQGQTSQDHSPDLGDAHTAWNHLDSLNWAHMVAYGGERTKSKTAIFYKYM